MGIRIQLNWRQRLKEGLHDCLIYGIRWDVLANPRRPGANGGVMGLSHLVADVGWPFLVLHH